MKKHFFYTVFIIVILASNCFGQEQKTGSESGRIADSLLSLLKTDKADTNKLIHLFNLSVEYQAIANYEGGLLYGSKALDFANMLIDLSKNKSSDITTLTIKAYKAKIYYNLGIIYHSQSNYSEAIKSCISSFKLKKAIGDIKGMASSYNRIGLIYSDQGNNSEALKYYLASLKIKEAIGDKKGISNTYNNIGLLYYYKSDYSKALKNHFVALKIRIEIGDKQGIAYSYNNIGNVYFELNNYALALRHHLSSLRIIEELGDQNGIANSYNNIAGVYYQQGLTETNITIRKNKLEDALKNFKASLQIMQTISNNPGISRCYTNIAMVLAKQKNYGEAKVYFIKSEKLSKEIGYKENLKEAYRGLSELDSTRANFRGAYENHKLFILYRDSLDNEETRKSFIQSQMTYDFEKKEAVATVEHKKELESQQVLAEEKSRKQKLVILLVVIGLVLVLVFAGFVFRSLRITNQQKNKIEQQKQEVEQQKHLVEEKQKEIIDSITYAKRLQQAILPSDEEIDKYFPNNFILYKPQSIVAGDFYWLHETITQNKESVVFIAAADSTGHGVPGAMVSVVCSNALNRAVNEFNLLNTGKILDKTRDLVLETFAKSGEEIKDGMDISLLSINRSTNEINWSGANNQLWYITNCVSSSHAESAKNKELIEIKSDKQPIGKTDNPKPFTTHTIKLNSGDTFYLMTDGYPDQFGGPKGKKYKYRQLQENLIATSNLALSEQKENLANTFDLWKGGLEQVDDVTIIGIRV